MCRGVSQRLRKRHGSDSVNGSATARSRTHLLGASSFRRGKRFPNARYHAQRRPDARRLHFCRFRRRQRTYSVPRGSERTAYRAAQHSPYRLFAVKYRGVPCCQIPSVCASLHYIICKLKIQSTSPSHASAHISAVTNVNTPTTLSSLHPDFSK